MAKAMVVLMVEAMVEAMVAVVKAVGWEAAAEVAAVVAVARLVASAARLRGGRGGGDQVVAARAAARAAVEEEGGGRGWWPQRWRGMVAAAKGVVTVVAARVTVTVAMGVAEKGAVRAEAVMEEARVMVVKVAVVAELMELGCVF